MLSFAQDAPPRSFKSLRNFSIERTIAVLLKRWPAAQLLTIKPFTSLA